MMITSSALHVLEKLHMLKLLHVLAAAPWPSAKPKPAGCAQEPITALDSMLSRGIDPLVHDPSQCHW